LNWDSQLVTFFNQALAHPLLDVLMVCVTAGAMPLSALGPLILMLAGKRREGLALLATFVLSTLLAVGLQLVVMRPRPADVRVVLSAPAFPSFPSGHAAAVFGGAVLVFFVWRRAGAAALLGAFLVALSRLYLGQHYPSDLLGGAVLGASVATAIYCRWFPPARAKPR